MLILAIESSCDETSASIVKDGSIVLSNVVSSSSNLFQETGGVVPEVAARKQLDYIVPVIQKSLHDAQIKIEDVDYFGVTVGPGLVGSLLVGINAAKTLSLIYDKPIIPVNHLFGHIYSVFITDYLGERVQQKTPEFPNLSLVVSGGHTDLVLAKGNGKIEYLGGTRDDAAGEAFDKVARVLGLSKYLGGPLISKSASQSTKKHNFKFSRPMINSGDLDFSFSGLKTAVTNYVNFDLEKADLTPEQVRDISYEFEQAVVDVLLAKTKKAFDENLPKSVSIVGGVAANSKLRKTFEQEFSEVDLFIPPLKLCGDNAAMIGAAAFFLKEFATEKLDSIDANPGLSLEFLAY